MSNIKNIKKRDMIEIFNKILTYNFNSILDIGTGKHTDITKFFTKNNKELYSIDITKHFNYNHPNYHFIKGDFMTYKFNKKFDAILASHVMEHIQDTGIFLNKIYNLLNDNGIFFVIVPPYKNNIVGGHISTGWNIGSLMYNLILTGFDVRNGRFKRIRYNIVGFVKKRKNKKLPKLTTGWYDIETLKDYFPDDPYFKPNFKGDMKSWNWFEED